MIEIKMENRKSNVCQNGDLGAASACHKIPDQVGDDRKVKCSGMTERNAGTSSNSSFLGLTRESSDNKKIPAFAGMTENIGSALTDSRLRRNDVLSHTCGERGRSMVEVLAVAGVLSIGGVAGYRWAMDKYRANDTIRELSQRAVVHSQQMLAGNTVLSNAEFNPANQTRLGYGLTQAILAAQPDFFEIRLSDVPERVCQNIVDSDWVLPSGWEINGSSEDGVMCAATNSMAFFFHRVLDNTKAASGEETTTSDITTSSSTPETTYTDYETTYTDYETTYTDYETTVSGESDCSGHGTWNGSSCDCDTGWSGDDCSDSECGGHGQIWYDDYCLCDRGWTGSNGYTCDTQEDVCNGHGVWMGCGCRCDAGWSGGYPNWCSENIDVCSGHGVLNGIWGCLCDDGWYGDDCSLSSCSEEEFANTFGGCYSCSSNPVYKVTAEECAKCGNRTFSSGGYCAKICSDGQFMAADGSCYSCSTTSRYSASAEECAKCDDTETPRVMRGSYCQLSS